MNTLRLKQLSIYLIRKKSTSAMILLSLFCLPFALIYTRGILGWIISILILALTVIPISMIAVLFGATYFYEPEFIVGYCIAGIFYFIFAITDAGRTNEKLLHELRFTNTMDILGTNYVHGERA